MEKCGFLIFFISISVLSAANREKGWEDVFGEDHSTTLPIMIGGNKSYLLVTSLKLNFMQAMDFCENIHMNLLTIENPEESELIKKYVINANVGWDSYWSSGSRLLDGKSWLWLTTGNILEFTNWGSGEPNGRSEMCIAIERRRDKVVWNDLDCDREMSFICERPLDEVREDSNPDEKNWENVIGFKTDSPNLDMLHFKDKDYYFSREYMGNYLESIDFCKAIGMKLVTIESKEENDRLHKYIRDTNAGDVWWSSGTRLVDGKNWIWFTKNKFITFTNWAPGEPSSVEERCIQLKFERTKGLLWNDMDCEYMQRVICERPSDHWSSTNDIENHVDDEDSIESDDVFLQRLKETEPGSLSIVQIDGRKFYVSRQMKGTPSQAKMFCEYHKMKLLDIKNQEENLLVAKILPYPVANGPFWTDGKKSETSWVWNSSKEPIIYFNWEQHSPSHKQEANCLGVTNFGKYTDYNCNKKKAFICESPEDENNTEKDTSDAVVNVFMVNNLVTKDGEILQAKEMLSSQNVQANPQGGYHVIVENDLEKC